MKKKKKPLATNQAVKDGEIEDTSIQYELNQDELDPITISDKNKTSLEEATDDPLKILEKKLEEVKTKLSDQEDKFIRLQAETDNFRKRLAREKEDFSKYANERLFKALIPIFDNFERALEAPSNDAKILKEGLNMILKQLSSFMEKEQVEPIKAIGEKFDPAIHEALTSEESEEHQENTIISQFVKGYTINGRVLRPAQVIIAKKTSSKQEESPKKEENLTN